MRGVILLICNELLIQFFMRDANDFLPLDTTTSLKSIFMLTTILCALDHHMFESNCLGKHVLQIFPVGLMLCVKRAPITSECASWSRVLCALVVDICWALLSNLYVCNMIFRIIRKSGAHTMHFFLIYCIHIVAACNKHTIVDFLIRLPCFYTSTAIVNFAPIFLLPDGPPIPPHTALAVSAHILFADPYVTAASCLAMTGLSVRIFMPTMFTPATHYRREKRVEISPNAASEEDLLRQELQKAKAMQMMTP